ncbi:MAG: lysophospholipid acyltransferase family protein [Pseudomonadota bacterium]
MNIFHLIRGSFILVWVPIVTFLSSCMAIFVSILGKSGNQAHIVGRIWARCILWPAGVKVTIKGLENIEPDTSCIYAANHQSQFDIPAVLGYLPIQFRWLAKRELFQIPVFGFAMRRAGYLPVDRSHPKNAMKSLEEAAQRITEGKSVLIFPEGTRSHDGKLLPFKPGGIILALKSQCPIIPMAIMGTRDILPRGSLLAKPGRVEIRIGQRIETTGLGAGRKELLSQKLRCAIEELMGINDRKHDTERGGRGDAGISK